MRAGKRREEGSGVSHAPHAALLGKPREEAFDEAFAEKTRSCGSSQEPELLQFARGLIIKEPN